MVDGDDTKQPPSVDNTTSNLSIAKKVDVTATDQSQSTSSISASLADVITAKATSSTVSTAMQIDTPSTEVVAKPSTNNPTSNKMSISNLF